MAITDRLILPGDVELTRAADIDPHRLAGIEHRHDDRIATRPGSRTPSLVVADDLAGLLELFRGGTRIVDAVIEYARRVGRDPYDLLDEALPALNRFIQAKWLVPEGSPLGESPAPWHLPGARLAGMTLTRCLRVLEDCQTYQARSDDGRYFAIKAMDEGSTSDAGVRLAAEASVLRRLGGSPSPAFVDLTADGTRHLLVMEWCTGIPVTRVAREHHLSPPEVARRRLHRLLLSVLETYAKLHDLGVLHGDVHPDNIIVNEQHDVRLVDFGLAQSTGDRPQKPVRGGVPEYLDPELARAFLDGVRPPSVSARSEQYSLAALCYRLATGCSYTTFPKQRTEFLRCVVEAAPLPFIQQGVPAWPGLEQVLAKALSKESSDRFASVSDLASAVARIPVPTRGAAARASAAPDADLARLVAGVDRRLSPDGELYAEGVAVGPRATVMTGAAGVAYYLLRSAMSSVSASLLAAADQWTEQAGRLCVQERGIYDDTFDATEDVIGTVSPYHTESGIEVVRGLVAQARGDAIGLGQAVGDFIRLTGRRCADTDPTLGRTSVLIGSALLDRAVQNIEGTSELSADLSAALRTHAGAILDSLWQEDALCGPIGDRAGVRYTGIAHGWAGILYATLVWSEVVGADPPAQTERRLSELASLCVPEGRGVAWPMRLGPTPLQVMRGWCHGAAGQVHLWNAAHRVLGVADYQDLAVKAAWNAADSADGGASICCGEAGRVFALLSMYRHSGEAAWLHAAQRRAVQAARQVGLESAGGLENSLYKGELGVALAIRELEQPTHALHPLFEVEPSSRS